MYIKDYTHEGSHIYFKDHQGTPVVAENLGDGRYYERSTQRNFIEVYVERADDEWTCLGLEEIN